MSMRLLSPSIACWSTIPRIQWIWPEDWTPDGTKIVAGVKRIDGTAQIAAGFHGGWCHDGAEIAAVARPYADGAVPGR